jgi:TonB family protein
VFLIDENGEVADAVVKKSSGDAVLDQATLEAVRKCRFKPGIKDGKPVSAWMWMQYVWRLD